MISSLLARSLADRFRATLWWMLGTAGATFLVTAMYPTIRNSDALRAFLDDVPPAMLALFGVDPKLIFTGAGFLQAQIFSIIAPTAVIAFCVTTAVRATASEERDGTMDLLLSLPISRASVLLQKTLALAILSLAVVVALAVCLLLSNTAFDLALSVSGVISASLGLWLLGLVFGGVALLAGTVTGNPGLTAGLAFVSALVAWLVTSFSALYPWLEHPAAVSPFTAAGAHQPLLGNWSGSLVWLLLGFVALVAGAVAVFRKRDIGTLMTVLPRKAEPLRAVRHVPARAGWLLRSVFGKGVWDYRRTIWLWAGGMSVLVVATAAAWPSMSKKLESVQALMTSLPRELLAMIGMSDPAALATPAGFVSSRAYLSIGPVVMIFFCVGAVSRLLSREERSGVLDLVLHTGQPRRRVSAHKLAAVAALAGLIVLTMTCALFIANELWALNLPATAILGANIGLALLGLFFAGIAAALWARFGSRGPAIRITVAIAVMSHFMNALGSIVEALAPLRAASPFYWYIGDSVPLARAFPPTYLLLLAGGLAGAGFAAYRFDKRDLY